MDQLLKGRFITELWAKTHDKFLILISFVGNLWWYKKVIDKSI